MIPPAFPIGTAAVAGNLLKRKWSVVILRHVSNGLTEPAAICKLEEGLTPTALNERLRMLLRYSLIIRNARRAKARAIEYQVTPRGHQILKMLTLIEQLDEPQDKAAIVVPETSPEPEPLAATPQTGATAERNRPARKVALKSGR